MSEKPWSEIKRRWDALDALRGQLVEDANDALARSAGRQGALGDSLRARSDALFEAEEKLGKAMAGDS